MGNQLTNEQIVLLNNLLYCENNEDIPNNPMRSFLDDGNEGKTVGEFIDNILRNESNFDDNKFYSTGVTGKEYKQLLNAVKNDSDLRRLEIKEVHIDPTAGAGGKSALFVDPVNNEAIVAFKGTESSQEWGDNFSGISVTDQPDGVSTQIQKSSLDWYESLGLDGYDTITVTGHSKGGNKAKYITIMDDSVDRCISIDGQGFSDEFIDVYSSDISLNQHKICNLNTDGDFVNILLNDVGEAHYYQGENYSDGIGGFAENHCPNAILKFNNDGSFSMIETTQDPRMEELDRLLNSYIRSVPQEQRQATGAMLAIVVDSIGTGKLDDAINALTNEKNREYTTDLLAYILKYKQKYPELMNSITSILDEYGAGDVSGYIGFFDWATNNEMFMKFVGDHPNLTMGVLGVADWAGVMDIPDWVMELLKKRPELFGMLSQIADKMRKIDPIRENGDDKRIDSVYENNYNQAEGMLSSSHNFNIDINSITNSIGMLNNQINNLNRISTEVNELWGSIGYTVRKNIDYSLHICSMNIVRDISRLSRYENGLTEIKRTYQSSEAEIIANLQ